MSASDEYKFCISKIYLKIHSKIHKIRYSGPSRRENTANPEFPLTRFCFKAAVSLSQQKLFLLSHLFHLLDLPLHLLSLSSPISSLFSRSSIGFPPDHRHHEQRTPKEAVHYGRVRTSPSSLPTLLICPPRVAIDARRRRPPPSRMSSNGPHSTSLDMYSSLGILFNGVASSAGAQSHPIYLLAWCSTIGKMLEADLILSQATLRDRFLEYGYPILLFPIVIAVALNTQRWMMAGHKIRASCDY